PYRQEKERTCGSPWRKLEGRVRGLRNRHDGVLHGHVAAQHGPEDEGRDRRLLLASGWIQEGFLCWNEHHLQWKLAGGRGQAAAQNSDSHGGREEVRRSGQGSSHQAQRLARSSRAWRAYRGREDKERLAYRAHRERQRSDVLP